MPNTEYRAWFGSASFLVRQEFWREYRSPSPTWQRPQSADEPLSSAQEFDPVYCRRPRRPDCRSEAQACPGVPTGLYASAPHRRSLSGDKRRPYDFPYWPQRVRHSSCPEKLQRDSLILYWRPLARGSAPRRRDRKYGKPAQNDLHRWPRTTLDVPDRQRYERASSVVFWDLKSFGLGRRRRLLSTGRP